MKKKNKLYEEFHGDRRLQKRIISDKNFTYRELIRIMKPYLNSCKTVLDIGSGVGTIDFYLASKGKKVTGIEISEKAVELAKANAKRFFLNNKIIFINAAFPHKITKKDFDMVIFSEVIEHIPDDAKAIHDIYNVMKSGGILIITTPSLDAPLYKMGLLTKFDKEVGHLRRYTDDGLRKIVEKNGFNVLKMRRHEGILRNFLYTNPIAGKSLRFVRSYIADAVMLIDRASIPLFGSSNISLVAKKK